MKDFIKILLKYVIIIFIISICINTLYIKRDKSDSDWTDKYRTVPYSIMICNFGSSHGLYGFNYEDLRNTTCFNFALASQHPSYDKRIYDYYKDHISKDAIIFIPVSFFSIYGNDEITDKNFLQRNKRYYKVLPSSLIKDYSLKTDLYVNYMPSLASGLDSIKTILFGASDNKMATWSRKASDIDLEKDAEIACYSHLFENKLDENDRRIINDEEVNSLKLLIKACIEAGQKPILLTPPYLQEYTNEIKIRDPAFLDQFYNDINHIAEESGVPFFDYSSDSRFSSRYDLFMDSNHLNKDGARQFVEILTAEVRQ